jgi:hypothetical protein
MSSSLPTPLHSYAPPPFSPVLECKGGEGGGWGLEQTAGTWIKSNVIRLFSVTFSANCKSNRAARAI